MENEIKDIIKEFANPREETLDDAVKRICALFNVVGQSEQLAEEKLCRMNQNFVCNCIDDSRCPNFRG